MGDLFAHAVAAILGALVGASALLATRHGVRFMTPEQPELGVARAIALMGAGMIGSFLALLACFIWAREFIAPFGIGLVAGFLVPAFVALFRFSGIAGVSSGGGR
jgi:Na+-driven multidrug efflux pump